MNIVFENCFKYVNGSFIKIAKEEKSILDGSNIVVFVSDCVIFPAFCDVHVHLREPGFFYKESIETGTKAAARGGFSDVCSMPNLNPVPDSVENLRQQLEIIKNQAVVKVHPYAAITKLQQGKELADLKGLASMCVAFSDDGKGVQNADMMLTAMQECGRLKKIIAAHCEDESLLFGGYIHDGDYAQKNGHKGICSESEWGPVKRDIELLKNTDCSYHVCHVSAKETVDIIRKAKKEGIDITCETAPHYLTMDDSFLQEDGRFKMNPPLRSKADREALIEGLLDGTIDMIATDHAPHSVEEKSKGLEKSAFGVVGLETAFPVMYTYLVKTGIITLEKLVELMCINPRKRFGLEATDGDYTVWKLDEQFTVDSQEFLSKGRSTPFENAQLFGRCMLTVCENQLAYLNI